MRAEQHSDFKLAIQKMLSLHDSTMPWLVIAAIVILSVLEQPPFPEMHELIWANIGTASEFNLGFGGWWMVYVSRPVFFALVLVSLWRLVLLFLLFKRIAALDLEIVPTHPDRAGGLGFLEKTPNAFSLFAFAISLVMASRLAHEVIYHGVKCNHLSC